MTRLSRENFLITGLICIVFGAFFTVANVYAMAGTVGFFGILLFIIGMTMNRGLEMSDEEIAAWLPPAEQLPDAGRVMYRVDTTLDDPIRTSILCGQCSKITVVEGKKPSMYVCSLCEIQLWEEE
ncbi:MAG: hypothetical protein O2866_03565 [archaeon]|nr:hypothetical protein [archaeon]MDA0842381.1 hypothetical protein [archaeon]MDA1167939.1 hypothetical protein [archaeon]